MPIDTSEITFTAVNDVCCSWDQLKATPDCDIVVAETLFRKIIEQVFFEKRDPTAEADLPAQTDPSAPLFKIKATMFVKMLDVVLSMLGPDLIPMAVALQELGAKHLDYGVAPNDYTLVGEALFYTLQKYLGDKAWTPRMEKSWRSVYSFISEAMIAGTELEANRRAAGEGKRMSIPPRKSKLGMDRTVAKSLAKNKMGLMGMLDDAISVSDC
ncbi:globin-like protein [Nitzschia inconspicua]|uniref:Globin-like protein n=1 Tax=Nitzschia inconspicua TaxID=303405 RepID=A0A9K3PBJ4_9STRA|nr:globin-like protein [Nitzschia inconspicua]